MIRRRRYIGVGLRDPKRLPMVIWFLVGAWILLAFSGTTAQQLSLAIDDDVCGCSAAEYRFVLDFSLSCPPHNISTGTGSGVQRVSCLVSPFGAPTTKLNPVVIDSVSILELDQSNNVLVERRVGGGFVDGDSFSYSSIVNNDDEVTRIQNIPKGLQLNLSGRNEDGVMLMNVFVISFTNECGVTPVIQVGESAGWVRFTEMSGPISRFCPTREPSSAPSEAPSPSPSSAPSSIPSTPPSNASTTQKPSDNPTFQPTKLLTVKPTLPTEQPVAETTWAPTKLPPTQANATSQPSTLPTTPPIFGLSTEHPTLCPTDASTESLATEKPTARPATATKIPVVSEPPSLFESMSMSMSLSRSFGLNSFDMEFLDEVDLRTEFLND